MRRNRRSPLLLPLRGFSLLALALVLWSGLAAASDLHPIRHAEGHLWRIERGGAPPSHIIGTIHIADPRVRDLPGEGGVLARLEQRGYRITREY